MPSITLTLHHDYEGGTTVEGTTKNSPAHRALKNHRSWTWSRYANAWLLRSSRHRPSKPYALSEIERVLTELGYLVERDIDDTMPRVAEQEDDLAHRMASRQDHLGQRAETLAERAAATRTAAEACFPDNGQPLLVDHHSYTADKNRRERGATLMDRSLAQRHYADELARRADSAAHHMGARYNPVTVANRLEKQEADKRRFQRELDGEGYLDSDTDEHGRHRVYRATRYPTEQRAQYLRREIATLDQHIEYWKRVYAQLQDAGTASTLGPDDVATGDWICINDHWARVRRVNSKSVSIPNPVFPAPKPGVQEHTRTVRWHKISDHRRTADMDPAFVETYEAAGTDRMRQQAVRSRS